MEVAKLIDDVGLDPVLWGVDRIEYVPDPSYTYTATTSVRGRFVWNKPRQRTVQCPTYYWWVKGQRFGGVVKVVFDDNGNVDMPAMRDGLRKMIRDSKRSTRVE